MPVQLILTVSLILCVLTVKAQVVVSEFVAINTTSPSGVNEYHPWIEIQNISIEAVDLADFRLSLDTLADVSWLFPPISLAPGDYLVVHLSGNANATAELEADMQISADTKYIALVKAGLTSDLISFPFLPNSDESIGRNPRRPSEFIHYAAHQVTKGYENANPTVWKKLTNNTGFAPRDSSPNASLVFDDKMWVLAGYRFTGTDWQSSSDVWCSKDGIDWELKNANPPYDAYSAFVVFDGKMWAFDPVGSYSSVDGVEWTNEAPYSFPGGSGARITVFNGELWYYNNMKIGKSADGLNWTIVVDQVPWGGNRAWPGFIEHNGKLFFFGGGVNYFTGEDYYYNDVWASSDGVHWDEITTNAEWPGRFWFSYFSFDGKIWMIGGWNYFDYLNEEYGNLRDVWISEDGKDWKQLISKDVWATRHSPFTWVKDNALYVSSGYGGGGRMYNDVWLCEAKDDLQLPLMPDSLTYGNKMQFLLPDGVNVEIEDTTVCAFDIKQLVGRGSGSTRYKLHFPGSEQYYPTYEHQTIVVRPRDLVVSVSDTTIVYGDQLPIMAIKYSGFVIGDDISSLATIPVVSIDATDSTSVGTYPISIKGGSADNYLLKIKEGTLTINAKPLLVGVQDATRRYGDENPTFSLDLSHVEKDDLSALIEMPEIVTEADVASPVGSYSLNISAGVVDPNYYTVEKPGNLTITPRALVVNVVNSARHYGDQNPEFELQYSGFVRDDNETDLIEQPVATATADLFSPVGSYEVTVAGGASVNYELIHVSGTLEIKPVHRIFTYPNPAVTEINFATPYGFTEGDFIEFYSQQGFKVSRYDLQPGADNQCKVFIERLLPGMYLYRLKNAKYLFEGKLVIM